MIFDLFILKNNVYSNALIIFNIFHLEFVDYRSLCKIFTAILTGTDRRLPSPTLPALGRMHFLLQIRIYRIESKRS